MNPSNHNLPNQWPGDPTVFKLKDSLILAIPQHFDREHREPVWMVNGVKTKTPPFDTKTLPVADQAPAGFYLPDYAQHFHTGSPKGYLDKSLVQVAYIAAVPAYILESGLYTSTSDAFTRRMSGLDLTHYEFLAGLRCYKYEGNTGDSRACYGDRNDSSEEFISMRITVPPYQSATHFPNYQVRYRTKKYGGVQVSWRSHMDTFPHWKQIDAELWKYIEAWNIAPKDAPNTITPPPPPKRWFDFSFR